MTAGAVILLAAALLAVVVVVAASVLRRRRRSRFSPKLVDHVFIPAQGTPPRSGQPSPPSLDR